MTALGQIKLPPRSKLLLPAGSFLQPFHSNKRDGGSDMRVSGAFSSGLQGPHTTDPGVP